MSSERQLLEVCGCGIPAEPSEGWKVGGGAFLAVPVCQQTWPRGDTYQLLV